MISLSILLLLIIAITLHYIFYMVPIIKKISEEKVRSFATSAVGKAATETITNIYSYNDLIEVTKDSNGNIALIQANSLLIHTLIRSAAAKAGEAIAQVTELHVEIPIGTLSGIALFAGRGANITVKIIPVGIISTKVHSEFISAGINQTLHRIYVEISADVNVILPGLDSRVTAGVPVPIAESVIIGKVPDIYFNSGLFDNMLNLTA